MVTSVGENSKYPPLAVPAQNATFARLILFKVRVLLLGPPVAFQVTCTFDTVIASWGFVMDKLITFELKRIELVVMLSQPGFAVGVVVGVNVRVGVEVSVGVRVGVRVDVMVGTSVGVLLGNGVIVITSPG